jgi:hypothetical protein
MLRIVPLAIKIIFSYTLIIAPLGGVIREIDNFEDSVQELLALDEASLVVFDVDETLICPEDSLLHFTNRPYLEAVLSRLTQHEMYARYPKGYLESKVMQEMAFKIIDTKSLEILETLKSKKVPTIACTAADAGPRGVIESVADWRIAHLKELGFDFSHFHTLFQDISNFTLPARSGVAFKSGVLFSSTCPKGIVLSEFFAHTKFLPKKVVVFDDRYDFIHSIHTALTLLNIESVCYLYHGAKRVPPPAIDEDIVQKQMEHLLQTGKWLSDQKARSESCYVR